MKTLRYEKVGDISETYSFLEVYFKNEKKPFMEISVTDNKELKFTFYRTEISVELTLENWNNILKKGKVFLPQVIKDEEDFNNLY